jgi:hypothetical protein
MKFTGGMFAALAAAPLLCSNVACWDPLLLSHLGFGSGQIDERVIASDSRGNLYTAGTFRGTVSFGASGEETRLRSAGDADGFLHKRDAEGQLIWVRQLGGKFDNAALDVAVDERGDIIVVGYFTGSATMFSASKTVTTSGHSDGYLAKLDGDGEVIWARVLGSASDARIDAVDIDLNGNVFVTGAFKVPSDDQRIDSASDYDGFVEKRSAEGELTWSRVMDGESDDFGRDVTTDDAGNVYTISECKGILAQDSHVESGGLCDVYVQKRDDAGNLIWSYRTEKKPVEAARSVSVDFAGNVYAVSVIDSAASLIQSEMSQECSDDQMICLRKLNSSGELLEGLRWKSTRLGRGLERITAEGGMEVIVGLSETETTASTETTRPGSIPVGAF